MVLHGAAGWVVLLGKCFAAWLVHVAAGKWAEQSGVGILRCALLLLPLSCTGERRHLVLLRQRQDGCCNACSPRTSGC